MAAEAERMQNAVAVREFPDEAEAHDDSAAWVRQVRQSIRDADTDFFRVSPVRYWADFLLSLFAAYTAAAAYLSLPFGTWPQLLAFPVAAFWLYRLGSLIHEVCHLGQHEMTLFKGAWNLLAGVMTLTPSPFFTRHHRDHHSQRFYGTPEDPEYVANCLESGNPAGLHGLRVRVSVPGLPAVSTRAADVPPPDAAGMDAQAGLVADLQPAV
jgi:hypothetical protein